MSGGIGPRGKFPSPCSFTIACDVGGSSTCRGMRISIPNHQPRIPCVTPRPGSGNDVIMHQRGGNVGILSPSMTNVNEHCKMMCLPRCLRLILHIFFRLSVSPYLRVPVC